MSRRGNCLDSAPMESFFASLKKEGVHHAAFRTREEAKTVFDYIEALIGIRGDGAEGHVTPPAQRRVARGGLCRGGARYARTRRRRGRGATSLVRCPGAAAATTAGATTHPPWC